MIISGHPSATYKNLFLNKYKICAIDEVNFVRIDNWIENIVNCSLKLEHKNKCFMPFCHPADAVREHSSDISMQIIELFIFYYWISENENETLKRTNFEAPYISISVIILGDFNFNINLK